MRGGVDHVEEEEGEGQAEEDIKREADKGAKEEGEGELGEGVMGEEEGEAGEVKMEDSEEGKGERESSQLLAPALLRPSSASDLDLD